MYETGITELAGWWHLSYPNLTFDTEREYKLCPSTCVLLIEIIATINLYKFE